MDCSDINSEFVSDSKESLDVTSSVTMRMQ